MQGYLHVKCSLGSVKEHYLLAGTLSIAKTTFYLLARCFTWGSSRDTGFLCRPGCSRASALLHYKLIFTVDLCLLFLIAATLQVNLSRNEAVVITVILTIRLQVNLVL